MERNRFALGLRTCCNRFYISPLPLERTLHHSRTNLGGQVRRNRHPSEVQAGDPICRVGELSTEVNSRIVTLTECYAQAPVFAEGQEATGALMALQLRQCPLLLGLLPSHRLIIE